mgnify:CR=1 FL=1
MNSIKDEEKNESNGPLVSKPSYGGKEDSEEEPMTSDIGLRKQNSGTEQPFRIDRSNFLRVIKGNLRDHYCILTKLGEGSFGFVYKAMQHNTEVLRAIKSIPKAELTEETDKQLVGEVEILRTLDHPNIIKIYEMIEEEDSINVVTELCTGGEMFDRIIALHSFSENKAAMNMFQIMSAVVCCHRAGIVHRDLKPENIVYLNEREDSALKVIDFGTSRRLKPSTYLKKTTGTVSFT